MRCVWCWCPPGGNSSQAVWLGMGPLGLQSFSCGCQPPSGGAATAESAVRWYAAPCDSRRVLPGYPHNACVSPSWVPCQLEEACVDGAPWVATAAWLTRGGQPVGKGTGSRCTGQKPNVARPPTADRSSRRRLIPHVRLPARPMASYKCNA